MSKKTSPRHKENRFFPRDFFTLNFQFCHVRIVFVKSYKYVKIDGFTQLYFLSKLKKILNGTFHEFNGKAKKEPKMSILGVKIAVNLLNWQMSFMEFFSGLD